MKPEDNEQIEEKRLVKNWPILLVVIIVIAATIYYFEQSKVTPVDYETDVATEVVLKDGRFPKAPELVGIVGYINADEGIQISDFKGKVVLIDFWTYTCINCIRTLSYLTAWDARYKDKGLVIIGVHTPEFKFEEEYDNVKEATERFGVNYRVVLDNDYSTWRNYMNRFWPHKFLIDSEGFVRYDVIGEGRYEQTEIKIQELLAEIGEDVSDMGTADLVEKTPRWTTTRELYAGYDFALRRGQDIGNPGGMQLDQVIDYTIPESIRRDTIYLGGKWKSNPEDLQTQGKSTLVLDFAGKNVNFVAQSEEPVEVEVFIDGNQIDSVIVSEPKLYVLYDGELGRYKMELRIDSTTFTFNAFTFG